MRFTWDPEKSDANLAARGFDFDFATLIFAGPHSSAKTFARTMANVGWSPSVWRRALR